MLHIKSGQDWNFEMLSSIYEELDIINNEKYQLQIYPNQIEIISSEQMLDANSSVALPVMFPYWQFGETFILNSENYKRGEGGLAYEVVTNTNPALVYCMEDNSAVMQALVFAHAGFGHNYFFANNYFFKQWTDADSIIDYLVFAKNYVLSCEEKYGAKEVEKMLDACYALQYYGVDKYKRPPKLSVDQEKNNEIEREKFIQSQLNEVWSTIPNYNNQKSKQHNDFKFPKEPQENILYFLEKNAPKLKPWQREIIRIVRKITQYLYPQMQTNVTNEGCASFWHYKFMHDLYDKGMLSDGAMHEFYKSHTGVVNQYPYTKTSQINPYALGFAIYRDIERISMNPTIEDKEWFKDHDWVGNGDWLKNVKYAAENFKNDSFILQYLSPKVIRDLKLFVVDDKYKEHHNVTAIHNDQGYKKIRSALSKKYSFSSLLPDIQIVKADIYGNRKLYLEYKNYDERPLNPENVQDTLNHLSWLWGYDVELRSLDKNDIVTNTFGNVLPFNTIDYPIFDAFPHI